MPTLTSIRVAAATVKVGKTVQLTATATYDDSSTADVTATSVWTSGNAYVTVSATGLATGVDIGVGYITATYSGFAFTTPVTSTVPTVDENEHHPWPGVMRGVWDFDGAQIVWTGDRVLTVRDGDYALGSSDFWNRNKPGPALKRGIPAYMPLQTDLVPPVTAGVNNAYVETCLTATVRAVVSVDPFSSSVILDVFDRTTETLIKHQSFAATGPVNPRVMLCGDRLIATWMDASPGALVRAVWQGDSWSTPSTLVAAVKTYECAVTIDGVHFVWVVAGASDTVCIGKLVNNATAQYPYAWGLGVMADISIVSCAIAVAPDTTLCVAMASTPNGLSVATFTSQGFTLSDSYADSSYDQFGGLALCSRGLKRGGYEWLVHYVQGGFGPACIAALGSSWVEKRYNTQYISKSFRVGDEVFIWAIDNNANTAYLLGGHYKAQVCGYADREVTYVAPEDGNTAWLSQVLPDPLTSGDRSGPYYAQKQGGSDTTYDSMAVTQPVTGDASITATATETTTFRWIALSSGPSVDWTLAKFGIRLRSDATIDVVESGTAKLSSISYATGDVFAVKRVAGVVTYYKNDAAIYTSATASTGSLVGLLLFYHLSSTLSGVTMGRDLVWSTTNSIVRTQSSGYGALSTGAKFSWARLFNTGNSYARPGNVRIGDMDFLPTLSTAAYGRAVYVSGSAVRCWDGTELGDAGFQSYPVVKSGVLASGGSLSAGNYYVCVYAVRYTKQGERFESAALVAGPYLATANQKLTLTIKTLPSTNHTDVVFEVYRTEATGTTMYLDGTVSNSLTASTVTYVCSQSDAFLRTKPGDPHETGVGQLKTIEEFGPIGCAILATSNDRLWGAGGQVPRGVVQFSKLHTDGSAVGFDDLAGYQEVDTEGGVITSICRTGDATVVWEATRLFVIGGVGPDNYGASSFNIPEIVVSDGATTHLGTLITPLGTVYWGDGGPRLLSREYQAVNISLPIAKLTKELTITGARIELTRQEIIWYTAGGDAVLWSYMGGAARWARWTGLPVAATSATALAMMDGRVLYPDETAAGDGGAEFEFKLRTGLIQPDRVLGGGTKIGKIGITGQFKGPHEIRFRFYYDGSPCWSDDEWIYQPQAGTYLSLVSDYATLTPAQLDALALGDQSGRYIYHARTRKNDCAYLQVEISNMGAAGPTFVPTEITLEIGVAPGLARVTPGKFR